MTTEAALTKLQFLVANVTTSEEIISLLQVDIAGEISES